MVVLNGATPPFELAGGWLLAGFRAAWLTGLFGAFGALLFRRMIALRALAALPAPHAARAGRHLHRLAGTGLMVALTAGGLWAAGMAADLADADGWASAVAALPSVLIHTQFGHLLLLQAACGAVVTVAWTRHRHSVALAGSSLAILLQAGHSHAAAMGSLTLLAADVLHLLGAAGWLGTLPPLLVFVAVVPPKVGALAARDYTPVGQACLAAIVASALVQAWGLIGSVPALLGTAYGWVALVKLVLLAGLTVFAVSNRYRLAPALLGLRPATARRRLLASLTAQIACGVLTVLAAAALSSLPPGMHAQPVWPFVFRPSLEAIQEPEFAREVILAGLMLASAGTLLAAAAFVRRRTGLALLVVAGLITWRAVPHLSVLLAEAVPTFYQTSPTGFAADSIVAGAALYPSLCASCHGTDGRGGPVTSLPVPPADLTAAHLWFHRDGELLWWLTDGMRAPDGRQVMPGFPSLTDDQRWALIDYIRARNAGVTHATTGIWSPPVQAPDFSTLCPGGRDVTLTDLRGRMLLLQFAAPPAVTVAVLGARPALPCISDDAAVWTAYATVTGLSETGLAGAQILVDGGGWLRAVHPPHTRPDWNDSGSLAAAIADIRAHPIESPPMAMKM